MELAVNFSGRTRTRSGGRISSDDSAQGTCARKTGFMSNNVNLFPGWAIVSVM